MGWVVAAAKHEILPDENSILITCIIECLLFVDTTTPDTDHELVAIRDELDPVVVPLGGDLRQVRISWDPAGATTKDIDVVDAEIERFAMCVWFLNQFCSSKADELGGCEDALTRAEG